ncbi:MAG: hypothetical protein ACXWBQ_15490, partial [Usitatibacter sp.]
MAAIAIGAATMLAGCGTTHATIETSRGEQLRTCVRRRSRYSSVVRMRHFSNAPPHVGGRTCSRSI